MRRQVLRLARSTPGVITLCWTRCDPKCNLAIVRRSVVVSAVVGGILGAAIDIFYQSPDAQVYCPHEVHDMGPDCLVPRHVTSLGIILGVVVGAVLLLAITTLAAAYNRKHKDDVTWR